MFMYWGRGWAEERRKLYLSFVTTGPFAVGTLIKNKIQNGAVAKAYMTKCLPHI
jgi:hypothetical protein